MLKRWVCFSGQWLTAPGRQMVKPTDNYPLKKNGGLDRDYWVSRLCRRYIRLDAARITHACDFVACIPRNGEKLLRVGFEFADLLGSLHQDTDSIIVAITYRSQRGRHIRLSRIETAFGPEITHLIREVNRMSTVGILNLSNPALLENEERDQSENVRKMLVALIDDVRVAVVKLAERVIALRMVKNAARSRRLRMAQETLSIFAPLANRLGIWRLKWELEDLSFRYLQAEEYQRVAKQLSSRREQREIQINRHISHLELLLKSARIKAIVEGRAKHIYSIWKKMQRKGIGFSEIYDGLAVRILVENVADCYAVLGVVHTQWAHIPSEFDDYIANSKNNGYQAIHTAVYDKQGSVLEVQIKTQDMHWESELGICAHWEYKNDASGSAKPDDSAYSQKLGWLRHLLSVEEEIDGINFESGLARVYVYTPDGHVVDLSQGSTPIDFAYRIHTDIGHRCVGAIVDGEEIALNTVLETGQRVEIITGSKIAPARDWLDVSRGYVHTARAREKIQAWIRSCSDEENTEAGQDRISDEMQRLGIHFDRSMGIEKIAVKMGYDSADSLYYAVAIGNCQILDILKYSALDSILLEQMDLLGGEARQPQQELIFVHCRNRAGLLHDITQILNDEHVTMLALNATTDSVANTANISVTSLVDDFVSLARVMTRIKSVPDVLDVQRQTPV